MHLFVSSLERILKQQKTRNKNYEIRAVVLLILWMYMEFLGTVQGQVNGVSLATAILEGDANGQETDDRRVISPFLDNIKDPYFLSFFSFLL